MEVAQSRGCRVESSKRRRRRNNKMKERMRKKEEEKKKKKLRTTSNEGEEVERGRGEEDCFLAAQRPISPASLFRRSSLSLIVSSFYFHEGEEPVCIRGVERKNSKSEGKGARSWDWPLSAVAQKAHQALKNPGREGPWRRWSIESQLRVMVDSEDTCTRLRRRVRRVVHVEESEGIVST